MVMEAPSPQCVGREFVRQYYTLLNEAPAHLFRFYSNNSSFVHGVVEKVGEDQKPAIGQAEIRQKILSLNFCDCHAKIRQVDSQATVGDGVVVQVTGELSNNGGAMRRFMQTFVLAQQTPKKYYVHNDIFRYQDDVFDDLVELVEEEEKVSLERCDPPVREEPVRISPHPSTDYQAEPQQVTPHEELKAAAPERTEVQRVEPDITEQAVNSRQTTRAGKHPGAPKASEEVRRSSSPDIQPERSSAIQDKRNSDRRVIENRSVPEPAFPLVDEPKSYSWANVVTKPSGSAQAPAVAVVPPYSGSHKPVPVAFTPNPIEPAVPVPSDNTNQQAPQRNRGPRDRPTGPRSRDNQRPPRSFPPSEEMIEKRQDKYPDNCQLFVGNLPHDITENDLKKFFGTFGTVVDIRINRGSQYNKVPFGFVVFDDEKPVKAILNEKRVEMGTHRLNVEEKKPKREDRPNSQTRSGGGRGSRPNRSNYRPPAHVPRDESDSTADGRSSNINKNGPHS